MNTSQALIEEIRRIHNLTSDEAAAHQLDITRAAVSNYRRGVSHMDNEIGLRAASLTGQDPLAVIASLERDRTHSPELRNFWGPYAKKLHVGGKLGAALLLTTIIGSGATIPTKSRAADTFTTYTFYELLKRLRRSVRKARATTPTIPDRKNWATKGWRLTAISNRFAIV